MTKFLISFPSDAMVVSADEVDAVVESTHAVIAEASAAGVYVFGGGIRCPQEVRQFQYDPDS